MLAFSRKEAVLRRGRHKPQENVPCVLPSSPLRRRVPPKFYGGTGQAVSWLREDLVALGDDLTLFPRSIRSSPRANPCVPQRAELAACAVTSAVTS